MWQLHLLRLVSMQRRRRRRPWKARAPSSNKIVPSRTKRKRPPCQQDGDPLVVEKKMHLGLNLPEDIWLHIYSLMPMRDAARLASVSRASLHSWRCHPTLTFSNESLGLKEADWKTGGSASIFCSTVSHILAMHSGIGLKALQIHIPFFFPVKYYCCVDSWLQTALKPGIEELTLTIALIPEYSFPCSFLSNGSGDSIRYIHLACCSFHPSPTFGSLRYLTRLHLFAVGITGEELECLLCNSIALERLEVKRCSGIVSLTVPCVLQQLSHLEVFAGNKLEAIDNKAPNVSSFVFAGDSEVRLSLGQTLQMKRVTFRHKDSVFYTCAKLPSMMPNLEALVLHSGMETTTPVLHSKFLHLRHLSINLSGSYICPTYDYLSLVNFLDAAPSLETFLLGLVQNYMKHVSIFDDSSNLRLMHEYQHHSLKSVTIKGFCCAKSLVELTLHIVESASSLECLTLEAPQSLVRCSYPSNKTGKCLPMYGDFQMEAHRGISAIRRYIEPNVPSTIKLNVLEPCGCLDAQL